MAFDWGGNTNRVTSTNPVISTNTTYLVSRNSASRRLSRNGLISSNAAGSANVNTISNLFIGCLENQTSFMQGAINEIIMYQAALSDTELNKLAGYLHWKWLNPEVLPISNIYRETVPKNIN